MEKINEAQSDFPSDFGYFGFGCYSLSSFKVNRVVCVCGCVCVCVVCEYFSSCNNYVEVEKMSTYDNIEWMVVQSLACWFSC